MTIMNLNDLSKEAFSIAKANGCTNRNTAMNMKNGKIFMGMKDSIK